MVLRVLGNDLVDHVHRSVRGGGDDLPLRLRALAPECDQQPQSGLVAPPEVAVATGFDVVGMRAYAYAAQAVTVEPVDDLLVDVAQAASVDALGRCIGQVGQAETGGLNALPGRHVAVHGSPQLELKLLELLQRGQASVRQGVLGYELADEVHVAISPQRSLGAAGLGRGRGGQHARQCCQQQSRPSSGAPQPAPVPSHSLRLRFSLHSAPAQPVAGASQGSPGLLPELCFYTVRVGEVKLRRAES